MELTNKTVLITGSSRGIGAATALAFAKAGSRVILNARHELPASLKQQLVLNIAFCQVTSVMNGSSRN